MVACAWNVQEAAPDLHLYKRLPRVQSKTQNLASMSKARAVGAADYRFFFGDEEQTKPASIALYFFFACRKKPCFCRTLLQTRRDGPATTTFSVFFILLLNAHPNKNNE